MLEFVIPLLQTEWHFCSTCHDIGDVLDIHDGDCDFLTKKMKSGKGGIGF